MTDRSPKKGNSSPDPKHTQEITHWLCHFLINYWSLKRRDALGHFQTRMPVYAKYDVTLNLGLRPKSETKLTP